MFRIIASSRIYWSYVMSESRRNLRIFGIVDFVDVLTVHPFIISLSYFNFIHPFFLIRKV